MSFNEYKKYLADTLDLIDEESIDKFINLLINYYDENKFIFIIGNGGSAAFASHLAEDLAKGTKITNNEKINKFKRFKALSLTDNTPFITAQGNDEGYESIFREQLKTFAAEGDLLIAISGSGNSPNIIEAIQWAKESGVETVGITGFDGGKLKQMCDLNVHIPINDMGMTESAHLILLHYIIPKISEILKTKI
jgi:D-sedoheptulose 7-phosphate isomerase